MQNRRGHHTAKQKSVTNRSPPKWALSSILDSLRSDQILRIVGMPGGATRSRASSLLGRMVAVAQHQGISGRSESCFGPAAPLSMARSFLETLLRSINVACRLLSTVEQAGYAGCSARVRRKLFVYNLPVTESGLCHRIVA